MTPAVQSADRTIADVVKSEAAAARSEPFLWATADRGNVRTRGTPAWRVSTQSWDHWAEWTVAGDTLTVRSDPFGLIPMFVFQRGQEIAVSASLQKLLMEGAAGEIDGAAMAVFLRLGFFIENDTPFVHIKALPPGATLTWRRGTMETVEGGPYLVRRRNISRDDAIDESIALSRQAVARRLSADDAVAIPLSGGRDSRHLLLELDRLGCRPQFAVTVARYPPNAAEDVRVAPLLASALALPHEMAVPRHTAAVAEARKNIATHFCADEHGWFYGMLDHVRGRATTMYEGIGGSLWTVGWMPERDIRAAWAEGRTTSVAERMLTKQQPVTDAFLDDLTPSGADWSRGAAVDRLSRELDRHAAAPDPGKSFHFWNRLRRELALVPCDMARRFAAVHTPLVDQDLAEFLLALPPEIVSPVLSRSDKSFHSEAISRGYPKYADIPFEDDAAPQHDPAAHQRQFAVDVAKHLLVGGGASRAARPFRWMRTSYVVPRLAFALVNRRYAESTPWLPPLALYLAQLERAVEA